MYPKYHIFGVKPVSNNLLLNLLGEGPSPIYQLWDNSCATINGDWIGVPLLGYYAGSV